MYRKTVNRKFFQILEEAGLLKSDLWIAEMAECHNIIEPFEKKQVSQGVISYGSSSYGYDLRLSSQFLIPGDEERELIDPKNPETSSWMEKTACELVISPGTHVLGSSLEYFRIPRDILGIVFGKSTYARSGLLINVTPLEPEWEGNITIALFNASRCSVKVYAGEGIAQVIFLGADELCSISYADRKGKYQSQKGVTKSIIHPGMEKS